MARPAASPPPSSNQAVTNRLRWIPNLSLNMWLRLAIGVSLVALFALHEAEQVKFRALTQMELWAYDTRLRLFMPEKLDPRIVILDIDEKSLNAEGRWPWSRNKLAEMIRQLFDRYKVKVVGFDVAFADPAPSSGLASLEQISKGDLAGDAEFQ